ncbi:hypothetical protein [Rufibacter quisquiliarum]|uniref:Uncharacterized protein n=1 Tax=Rufibacter quisquiliarum TaxID=1549639 RepID=A0A839GUA8_9BACT|nr:hypothetical protein [Rufibacter quisquiliarum]MBA9078376.1 hypothetical protein [Rufibacter quisquiliarum]
MAQRPRRTLGTPTFPMPISGKFLPATLLLVAGLALMIYQSIGGGVRTVTDLTVKEGTLINYSFRKTPEGERDYGVWLKEFSERFALTKRDAAAFDTAAFKAQVKPGDRVRVEYDGSINPLDTDGERKLFGLAVPSKNQSFLLPEETIKKNRYNWLTYLMYGLLAAGILLYIYKIMQMQRTREEVLD